MQNARRVERKDSKSCEITTLVAAAQHHFIFVQHHQPAVNSERSVVRSASRTDQTTTQRRQADRQTRGDETTAKTGRDKTRHSLFQLLLRAELVGVAALLLAAVLGARGQPCVAPAR